jgi:hypothetical protein
MGRAQQPTLTDPPQNFARNEKVKVIHPGRGESGTWIIVGWVTSSGHDDPAYDVRHERRGQPRIFRSSRLVPEAKPRPPRPRKGRGAEAAVGSRQETIPL